MKKIMIILALAGMVAGCAHNKGGTEDQNQMNSGTSSSESSSNSVGGSTQQP